MQTEFEKARQRVTEELESIEAELRAVGILQEEVHVDWNVTVEQQLAENNNLKNTLVVRYGDSEGTLCFTSEELPDTVHKPYREQLRKKLRQLLESLAGVRPVGFI